MVIYGKWILEVKKMVIKVKVTPSSKEDRVVGQDADGTWKVKVRAAPDKGKANQAVIDLLAKHFNKPKRSIIIKSGLTDRLKTIIIDD